MFFHLYPDKIKLKEIKYRTQNKRQNVIKYQEL